MPNSVDRTHIRSTLVKRAFSAAATSYDSHAALQREIGERLLAHLEFTRIEPRRILDIGCGTGYFTGLLRQKFKKADLLALDLSAAMTAKARSSMPRRLPWHGRNRYLAADAIHLPLKAASFDLVCSNLTMQWIAEPEQMLAEMRRVLAPGGLLLFSTFGRRTLSELRQVLAAVDGGRAGHVLPFPDVTALGDALAKLPVEMPVTDADLFTLTYPNTMSLIRELKGLGASASAIRGRRGGLYGRSLLSRLESAYAAGYGTEDGQVFASFEALYGQAWYKEAGFSFRNEYIPVRTAGA